MIRLTKNSQNHKDNFFFTDYFQFKTSYLILLTHNLEEHPLYKKINNIVLEKLLKENFHDYNESELIKRIKDFFIELNWQIYSLLSTSDVPEKGISLVFSIIRENNLYFVQFGRLLAGRIKDGEISTFGKSWNYLNIFTPKQLFLLGSIDDNINLKIYKTELKSQEKIVVLPSTILSEINMEEGNANPVEYTLKKAFKIHPFPYFLIERDKNIFINKSSFFTKTRITIAILILLVFFSVIYVFEGNNIVEDSLNLEKIKFTEELRNFPMDKIEEYGLKIIMPKFIGFKPLWEKKVNNKITYSPKFDTKRLFLVCNNKLSVYSKKDKNLIWEEEFNNNILDLILIDNGLILIKTSGDKLFCLERKKGDKLWESNSFESFLSKTDYPIVVSISDDRRLNTSLLINYFKKNIQILESVSGDTLAIYKFANKIDFISDYDLYDKCIYTVQKNYITSLKLILRK